MGDPTPEEILAAKKYMEEWKLDRLELVGDDWALQRHPDGYVFLDELRKGDDHE